MNFQKKLAYAWSLYKQFYDFHHRKTKLSQLPQISNIEVTNACNLNCVFCFREAVKRRGIGFMSLANYKKIFKEYGHRIFAPCLFLHGEPLLHPDIVKMVQVAHDSGVRSISLTTNGTLLTPRLFDKLTDAGLTGIEVSFEGTDKKTYESQRVGASYEETQRNIMETAATKHVKKLNMNLGISIIDNMQTHNDLERFKRFWLNFPGVDRVDVARLSDLCGENNSFTQLTLGQQHPFQPFKVCSAPWFFISLYWNGDVAPCCGWEAKPFGNIFTESLEQIWNGEEYVNFRKTMIEQSRFALPTCGKCQDGGSIPSSPFFVEPNRRFPFTWNFLKNAGQYLSWSHGIYRPTRQKR